MMALGDAAASLGVPVFACDAEKRPITPHGFKDATADATAIRAMFASASAQTIAMPTGRASGLVVIDVDVKAGAQGDAWLQANSDALPPTRTHKTRSGGLHLLFLCPKGVEIRNSASRIAPGVDVRGEGGYVIVPPSPGYAIADTTEPAEMPRWLISACLPPEREERPYTPPRPSVSSDGTPYGLAALEAECEAILRAPYGQQETTLNAAGLKIGALIAGGELAEAFAIPRLIAAGRAMPDQPGRPRWAHVEVERKVRRALEDGSRNPRQAPPRVVTHTVRYEFDPPDLPEPPPHEAVPEWAEAEPEVTPPAEETAAPSAGFDILNPTEWTHPAPAREWIVREWIPRGVVTALYGDGGMGKSLLAQQLLTSVATCTPWLGLPVVGGTALGIMCEDDPAELQRRQEAINAAMGLAPADLGNLALSSRVGFDNALMAFDGKDVGKLTAAFQQLRDACELVQPDLLVWDTIADGFAGNENNRPQVRQFVQNSLGRLARDFDCAVLLCGHPSVAGITNGTGTGGSTAWNNTVRSRLYLTRPEGEDAHPDARVLSRKKANYAARDASVEMLWRAGCFVPGEAQQPNAGPGWDVVTGLLEMIAEGWASGQPWSASPQTRKTGRYLPLAASRRVAGASERGVSRLLEEWLANGVIEVAEASSNTKLKGLRVLRRIDRE